MRTPTLPRRGGRRPLAALPTLLSLLVLLLVPCVALARAGGGEHYRGHGPSGGGGDGDFGFILWMLLDLTLHYPQLMLPVLGLAVVGYVVYQRRLSPRGSTQRAFQQREAELRTQVSSRDVQGWVNALQLKDPGFELLPLLDRTRGLFVRLQEAWFRRDLTALRPFLSDATYQRLGVQLQLLSAQGVRDAMADVQVLEVQIIGLNQSRWFDSVQLRVRAQMRDTDVPAGMSDEAALAAARRVAPEPFVEVWTFVRRPGALTRIGQDLYQGKCPNCGAPFRGGASNACEYCSAIVNSGNYDWTLSEITQGSEHVRHHTTVDGLLDARQADPALNLEMLEDRTSLVFWRWVEAQSRRDPTRLAKLAHADALAALSAELEALRRQGRRKVFLECAVGAVLTRALEVHAGDWDRAHVEVRWSARMGVGPEGERPPQLPTVPQRWMFTLLRRHGALTPTEHGLSTDRCPQCHAPLTDSAAPSCDYCSTPLGSGERDWVLHSALPFEAWDAREAARVRAPRSGAPPAAPTDAPMDAQERQRLLYMMAALAAADGEVDARERRLLRTCAERWSVPWVNVERALSAGPALFDRLIPTASAEAEVFLRHIVQMALVDGRVDRQERRMLEAAAQLLGIPERLGPLLAGR
ncbi:hypothetical protein FGE12_00555 [Aggregicoccus sp. 17bor-14]|uniref:TIM44-like domain-containing protein n=1 Tax=Myxococcaceae TaxID=31 RepID=UPI00129C8F5B|nr:MULTISPECIES: TIM44-like domain-containing protein [Myxococcaceae]MBF5040862.1 TIM44-like domain-containing protein [Simulacricoccus sp. 17bor-14]MRI86651.1 hypothetical protein [Aggregicoccus sp. 17bor-14]